MYIVKAKATFYTQTAMVRRTITTIDTHNLFIFNVIGDLATHTAEWTDRINLAIDRLRSNMGFWHQRTGWAGLHTLTTRHAGAKTHWIAEIKYDFAMSATHCITDHIIDLLFTARTHTTVTLNTGV